VKLPKPEAGLVINYSYLWLRQHKAGLEEGSKNRPCAIVLAAFGEDRDQVLVVPVTHSQPPDFASALEIPQDVKRLIGLDSERSWVILSESNLFQWPGPDLRPVGSRVENSIAYGLLPPKIFKVIRDRFLKLEMERKSARVQRTI
jgi:hypothetical protein